MLRIQVVAKNKAQLIAQANATNANQPEAVPWVYYDTQDIATGTQAPVSFFAEAKADKTLCNLDQGGTIPNPNFFEIEAFNMDILAKPAIDGTGAVIDDIAEILYTGRATFVFSISGKEYIRIPATYLHSSGGPVAVASGTLTAPSILNGATNGVSDGGFHVGKSIMLQPSSSFSVQLVFGAGVTLTATRKVRIGMAGVLHRRVL